MDIIELIKNILEEKGLCTIEELLLELLQLGVDITLDELKYIINSNPTIFK